MPATKYFWSTLTVILSLTAGSAHAENCLSTSSVDLMHITGDEDFSAMGQVASLATAATRTGHAWESNRTTRVEQAARIARVGAYAPAAKVFVSSDVASASPESGQPSVSKKPSTSTVSVSTSAVSGVRSMPVEPKPKAQVKAIKIQAVRKVR